MFVDKLANEGRSVGIDGVEDTYDLPAVSFPLSSKSACAGSKLLDATPEVLNKSGDFVVAKWKLKNSDDGWVGVFSPPSASHGEYLDFVYEEHLVEGSFKFALLNIRQVYELRLVRDGTCVARSRPITFLFGLSEPTHAHLQLAGRFTDDTAMRVLWASGVRSPVPTVRWGFASGELSRTQAGSSRTYAAEDMCGPPANKVSPTHFIDPGFHHEVLLDELPPDTEVFYRYGQGSVWSDEFSFRSPPTAAMTADAAWTFLMYADHGVVANKGRDWNVGMPGIAGLNDAVRALLRDTAGTADEPRLLLHVGDLAYAMGSGMVWDLWGLQIEDVARRVPYMVSVGNHEHGYAVGTNDPSGASLGFHPAWGNFGGESQGECGVHMVNRFQKPPPTGNGIFWYSFDFGNVHIAQLSSEHDFSPGSVQLEWLDQDLAAVNRSRTPWVIVTAHRPAYCSQDYPEDRAVGDHFAMAIDPVLAKHKVNLFLSGHYHSYERTCPVSQGVCHPDGSAPVHIMAGTAGGKLSCAPRVPASWSKAFYCTYGFLKLQVQGAQRLRVEFWGDAHCEEYTRSQPEAKYTECESTHNKTNIILLDAVDLVHRRPPKRQARARHPQLSPQR